MIQHAYLIPLIPFAASLIMMFGAKEDPHSPAPWIGIGAMTICLGLSLDRALRDMVDHGLEVVRFDFDDDVA